MPLFASFSSSLILVPPFSSPQQNKITENRGYHSHVHPGSRFTSVISSYLSRSPILPSHFPSISPVRRLIGSASCPTRASIISSPSTNPSYPLCQPSNLQKRKAKKLTLLSLLPRSSPFTLLLANHLKHSIVLYVLMTSPRSIRLQQVFVCPVTMSTTATQKAILLLVLDPESTGNPPSTTKTLLINYNRVQAHMESYVAASIRQCAPY